MLLSKDFAGQKIRVLLDDKEKTASDKKWLWIKRGVPLIVELGSKEIESGNLSFIKRDDFSKNNLRKDDFISQVSDILAQIQNNIFEKAKNFTSENIFVAETKENFLSKFADDNNCFVKAYWIGDEQTEKMLKEHKITSRCIPLETKNLSSKCIFTNQEGAKLTVFARAY